MTSRQAYISKDRWLVDAERIIAKESSSESKQSMHVQKDMSVRITFDFGKSLHWDQNRNVLTEEFPPLGARCITHLKTGTHA